MTQEQIWEDYNEKVQRIIHNPIKEGTLVKFKSREELLALNYPKYGGSVVDRYANRVALIIEVEDDRTYFSYKVYFPDDGDTGAWSYEEDFIVITDLLKDYR